MDIIRAAGLGTVGVYRIDCYPSGVPYTNTGNLTVTSTNRANIISGMLSLALGTTGMRASPIPDRNEVLPFQPTDSWDGECTWGTFG